MNRHVRRAKRKAVKEIESQVIDSRGGSFGKLKPKEFDGLECMLKFTKEPKAQTIEPKPKKVES